MAGLMVSFSPLGVQKARGAHRVAEFVRQSCHFVGQDSGIFYNLWARVVSPITLGALEGNGQYD